TMTDEYYFDTMGIAVLDGRNFRREDDDSTPRVAIVNEQLTKHYWPNQRAIGKRVRLVSEPDQPWVEIVGIAKTSKYMFFAEPPTDFIYLPYRQNKPPRMIMVAQSAGNPSGLVGPVREIVRGLDPNLPIFNVRTMEELYRMRAVSTFNVIVSVVAAMGAMG